MKIALFAPNNEFTQRLYAELQRALAAHTIEFWESSPEDAAVSEANGKADVELLLSIGEVSRQLLASCPRLALVQTISTGFEAVDMEAATEMGIFVSYAPSEVTGNADSVAEYAVMLLIATARRLGIARASLHDGSVTRPLLNQSLKGKTVCIVGLGSIGTRVADRLRPFGPRLTAVDENPEEAPADVRAWAARELKQGVADADFVVLCVRASEHNKHMINADVLAAMPQGSAVVNVARGTLIDENALAEALKSGHIAAAGLDVLSTEPPQPDDPLLQFPQVFATPHIAGFTFLTLEGTVDYVQKVVTDYKAGRRFDSLLNQPATPRWNPA